MYEQIVQILKKEILEHKYPEGGSIGTHEDLVKRFGVSLITVRRAVLILQKEGLVIIRQGKGTFVKTKAVSDDLSTLTVVNNILKHKDPAPKVVVKSIGLIKTPPYFDAALKKELGDECVRIVRAHMLDGVVTAMQRYISLKNTAALSQIPTLKIILSTKFTRTNLA